MSYKRNLLSGADNAHAKAASDQAPARRPYRAPELRELGAVADLTYDGPAEPNPYTFDGDGYAS